MIGRVREKQCNNLSFLKKNYLALSDLSCGAWGLRPVMQYLSLWYMDSLVWHTDSLVAAHRLSRCGAWTL